MKKYNEPIQQLKDIHSMMERSSRFISLSGLSGISAGLVALIGAAFAFFYLDFDQRYFDYSRYSIEVTNQKIDETWIILVLDATIVLLAALSFGIYFTTRKARKDGLKIWDNTSKRVVINLIIPLTTGGVFCIILLYHHLFFLIAPATLIFYGLSLLNASKYTLHEIRILGISEIILGLIASLMIGYGLLFWAFGFGILHIFYGAIMYNRYEKS